MFPQAIRDVTDYFTGMEAQCNVHDCCYSDCDEQKAVCDVEFRDLMYTRCDADFDTSVTKAACKTLADAMYAAVRDFGQSAYDASRVSKSCP